MWIKKKQQHSIKHLPETTVGPTLVKTSLISTIVLWTSLSVSTGGFCGNKLQASHGLSLCSCLCLSNDSWQKSSKNKSNALFSSSGFVIITESDRLFLILISVGSSNINIRGGFGLVSAGGVYGGGGLSGISRTTRSRLCCCSNALIWNINSFLSNIQVPKLIQIWDRYTEIYSKTPCRFKRTYKILALLLLSH